jgi:uncharacterized coiled-coil protein SlyX
MIDQIIQYLPQAVATLGAVAVPMIPAFIMKAVSDKKAITTFEGIKTESSTQLSKIKALAESLKERELSISKDVSSVKNMTETFKSEIEHIKIGVQAEMKGVKESVLAFQNDEIYQKMLNGLGSLDEIQHTMKLKDDLIEKQAQMIKEIHKKLGEMK